MPSTIPFGLKHTFDPSQEFAEYVIDSVSLINDHLMHDGRAFVFDTVDVHQQIIDGKHLWDMFGWVGSYDAAASALAAWNIGDESGLNELDYVNVTWVNADGLPFMEIG